MTYKGELDNNPQIIHARIQRAPKLARLTISHTYNLSLHSLGNSFFLTSQALSFRNTIVTKSMC